MTAPEQKGVLAFVQLRAGSAAYPISELIALDGANYAGEKKPIERNHVLARKNAGSHQKGVPRQEEADKQAGFHKNDSAYDGAKEIRANRFNELFQTIRAVEQTKIMKNGIQMGSVRLRLPSGRGRTTRRTGANPQRAAPADTVAENGGILSAFMPNNHQYGKAGKPGGEARHRSASASQRTFLSCASLRWSKLGEASSACSSSFWMRGTARRAATAPASMASSARSKSSQAND